MRAPVRSARKRSVKSHDDRPAEASSLAERVKKRRRVSQAPQISGWCSRRCLRIMGSNAYRLLPLDH